MTEFEKSKITALKRVRKSQREILKALGCNKTIICNYLQSLNKYEARKLTGMPEKLSSHYMTSIVHKVKKKLCQHQKYWNFCCIAVIQLYVYIYIRKHNQQ